MTPALTRLGKARQAQHYVMITGPFDRHDWLNKALFVATLTIGDHMPASLRLAGVDQNDQLIQVHRPTEQDPIQ